MRLLAGDETHGVRCRTTTATPMVGFEVECYPLPCSVGLGGLIYFLAAKVIAHATLKEGGSWSLPLPPDFNVLLYVRKVRIWPDQLLGDSDVCVTACFHPSLLSCQGSGHGSWEDAWTR